jgi:hypothetical protein
VHFSQIHWATWKGVWPQKGTGGSDSNPEEIILARAGRNGVEAEMKRPLGKVKKEVSDFVTASQISGLWTWLEGETSI